MTTVAVVTIVRGRGSHLRRMARGVEGQSEPPAQFVVVGMGEAPVVEGATTISVPCDDGAPLPLAQARNAGVAATDADLVLMLDVDCIPAPDVVRSFRVAAERFGRGLYAGDVRYLPDRDWAGWVVGDLWAEAQPLPIRPVLAHGEVVRSDRYELAWTTSLAIDRVTFVELGGFDERFVGYGAEDTDFTTRARRADAPLYRVGTTVFHQYHESQSPPFHHLEDIVRNARLYHRLHGEWPMRGWLDAFAESEAITFDPEAGELRLAARTGRPQRT